MIFEYFKPKFLTKEERAAEALKKRQDQVEAQRKKIQVCTITFPPRLFFCALADFSEKQNHMAYYRYLQS